jgi:hypothetical protein
VNAVAGRSHRGAVSATACGVHARRLTGALAAGAALAWSGAVADGAPRLPTPDSVAGYRSWTVVRTPYTGGNPAHGGRKSVYISSAKAARAARGKKRFRYPTGTVIVKQATSSGPAGGYVSLLAVMRKVANRGTPGDWVWAEYTRARKGARLGLVAGGDQGVCTGCHVGAAATDWAFTRPR